MNKGNSLIQILIALIAFCTYYLLVEFGSMFTIFLGFSSPIWPLSGVMTGLYFLFGRSIIVGSLLASLLILQQDSLHPDLPSYAILILASISVLQFVIAKQLVLRFCIIPINIRKPLPILKFLLLTGPLTVFISTLLFVLTLKFSLNIPTENLMYISLVKYIGDLLSIVLITPIFLFLKDNIFVHRTKNSTAAILVSLLSFSLISFIYVLTSNNDFVKKERVFTTSAQSFVEKFNMINLTIKNSLTGLNGLFQASDEVTRAEFDKYAVKIANDKINLSALAWLPLITDQERENYEANLVSQGMVDTGIKKQTKQGLIIAPQADFYLPLHYITNFDLDETNVGVDEFSRPILKNTINKAIKDKNHIISPLLSLSQHQDKHTWGIVYYPIYKKNPPNEENVLQGLVKVVFKLDTILSNLQTSMNKNIFTYQLTYGDNNRIIQPGYHLNSTFNLQNEIDIFDKKGQLYFASTPEFELSLINWQILIMMTMGGIIGAVCVAFVYFIVAFNSSLTRQIKEDTAKLLEKNKELTSANQAKNLFLANISHEYRTPLNAIMGFSEIALREIKDKNALEFFTKIEESSKILLSIVNDVLDTSKIQAGEINLENRPFSPSAVAQKVIDMLIVKATDKSITINKNFTSNFDLHVEGDDNRFKQIIINLLNNAIKFTHNGSISISGDSYDIDDKFRTLTLIIKDTGIGINKEDQKNLFIPFAQATSTKTREYGGTGLGLAIVKQLCSLMGGDITLRSQPDKGSTFTVTITLPKIEKNNDFSSPKSNKLKDSHYKEIKVLVVEDNKVNQFIVSKQLDFKGITCDFANDGLMALSYLKTKTPDLILMDLQMPNMDGFTASNLIKKNRALQNIPIVIISASVSNEDKEKASLLGINDFINKPFYQDDLLAVIDKYLKPKIDNSHLN